MYEQVNKYIQLVRSFELTELQAYGLLNQEITTREALDEYFEAEMQLLGDIFQLTKE